MAIINIPAEIKELIYKCRERNIDFPPFNFDEYKNFEEYKKALERALNK